MGNQTPQIQEVAKETEIPVPPPDNKPKFNIFKSKFFLLFIAISFLIAFAVGGFVLGKNNAGKQISPTPIPTPQFASCGPPDLKCSEGFTCDYCTGAIVKGQPTPKPNTGCACIPNRNSTSTPAATADWKTISTDTFSIKIPAGWYIESNRETYLRVQNYNPEGAPGREYDPVQDKEMFALQIGKLDKKASDVDELKSVIKELDAESASAGFLIDPTLDTNIIINGITAIKRVSKKNPNQPPIVYLLDGKEGVFFFTPSLDVLAGKDYFNDILSTFTFSTSKFTN